MNLKNELIKTLSHKISITEILHFEEKKLLKQYQREQYIYFGFCRVVVGGGRCTVAGGGGLGGGEYILADGGWWRVVVDGGGWWYSLA